MSLPPPAYPPARVNAIANRTVGVDEAVYVWGGHNPRNVGWLDLRAHHVIASGKQTHGEQGYGSHAPYIVGA